MASRVFIASSTFAQEDPKPLDLIKAGGLGVVVNTTGKRLDQQQLMEQAYGAHGVIAGLEIYDAQVLEHLKDLRCISRCGVGVDNIDMTAALKKGIKIFTTPDVVIQPVVELTLGLMLDILRRISRHNVSLHQRQWERQTGRQLSGKTVGIIGLGRIGRKMAETLLGLGVKVVGYDIHPDKEWAQKHGVRSADLTEVLKVSDIVTLHLAVDDKNPFVLTKKLLLSMKKGAVLINVARGVFVDEQAVAEVLKAAHLSGAGLDVFSQEPYAGPLCDLDNVILTPHIATLTQESRVAMEIEAAQNLVNFLE